MVVTQMSAIAVISTTADELLADPIGTILRLWGTLSWEVWQEPPWDEDNPGWAIERLIAGIPRDLNRSCAKAFIGLLKPGGRKKSTDLVGFTLGYQVFRTRRHPRERTLREIAGSKELDYLFDEGKLYYVDQLGVKAEHRKHGVGEALSRSLIEAAEKEGFSRIILRTRVDAEPAQKLYAKLGFRKLGVRDANYSKREWLIRD